MVLLPLMGISSLHLLSIILTKAKGELIYSEECRFALFFFVFSIFYLFKEISGLYPWVLPGIVMAYLIIWVILEQANYNSKNTHFGI